MAADSRTARRFTVDAVAFDLDGTLLDTIHDLAGSVNELLAELGYPTLPKPVIRDLVGKGIGNLLTRAIELARGAAPNRDEHARWFARYQKIYAARLGRETVPYPDVHEALDRFTALGLGLAVVTNKMTRFVRPHLEQARIAHYFGAIVGGDDAAAKKPDAAPLLLAARRLRVAPARMLMVGDSANDVDAARAAGCPVVVVPYGYSEGVPVQALESDGIVSSLLAVTHLISRATSPTYEP